MRARNQNPVKTELNAVTGHLLRKAHLTGQKCFADAFAGTNISPVQYAMLSVVSSNPGIAHKELAIAVATSASVTTAALKPLRKEKLLLTLRGKADARSTTYRISARGGALLKRLNKRLALAARMLEAPLSAKEARVLRTLLAKLIDRKSS